MRENWRVYTKFALLLLMLPAFWLAQWAIEQYVGRPALNDRLIAAVCRGDEFEFEDALRDGASSQARDGCGVSILSYAAQQGQLRIARRLIEAGANVNESDNDGLTPLMWATQGNHREIVDLLLAHGADATLRNHRGLTAREVARAWENFDLEECLRDAEEAQVCLNPN